MTDGIMNEKEPARDFRKGSGSPLPKYETLTPVFQKTSVIY